MNTVCHFNMSVKSILVGLMILVLTCQIAEGRDKKPRAKRNVQYAIAVNGFNEVLGEPAANLKFIGNMHFPTISVLSDDGFVEMINADTDLNSKLVSAALADVYAGIFGIPNSEDIPYQGLDFSEIPQMINLHGDVASLEQIDTNSSWWERANGSQIKGYTLREWLKANGRLAIKCHSKHNAIYRLRLNDLVPGGLYTSWAFFFDTQEQQLITDRPFGGTSANVFSADYRGKASVKQFLNFCPRLIDESERYQLVGVFVVLHPDGQVHGGVPHTVQKEPHIGPGINSMAHIMFAFP